MTTNTTTALLDSLKSAHLLPSKVIPEPFTPTFHLSVRFSNKAVSNGTLVRVHEVQSTPTISISPISPPSDKPTTTPSSSEKQHFTLMLIDPDAPTPDDPKFAYWRHWVVTNVSVPEGEGDDVVGTGRTLTQYLAPGPKDESGPHRAATALAQDVGSVSIASVSGCPAVVSTTMICSTCMTAACVVPATIVAGCGSCPATPPTIYRGFPCDQGCSNLGPCKTIYEIVTASDLCDSDDDGAEWPDHCEPGHDDDHGGRIR
ncbi:hypothetical protein NEMBOFW57_006708 [Staphylotrichum longicolle]|uniref:Phosphatidylethanolamine-binding protein n=1 Tax=Staphylotrichum longicolle TaxID=669026 RepID=A0AAD4ETA7_9PEZI|nr:hypothetical protein NEMBOFW57_006708 [Staphylotrichum longicolle]